MPSPAARPLVRGSSFYRGKSTRWRRHTGGKGIAWLAGPGIAGDDDGTRSAFDVVPTIVELVGGEAKAGLNGESFRREVEVEAAE